jgi:hypothetical protein
MIDSKARYILEVATITIKASGKYTNIIAITIKGPIATQIGVYIFRALRMSNLDTFRPLMVTAVTPSMQ